MTDTAATKPLQINFQVADCTRCDGSGMFGPAAVEGGRCFQCKGERKCITRNGRRARDAYDALMAERMSKPVEEITEGSRVYTDGSMWVGFKVAFLPWAWRTVRSVSLAIQSHTANGENVTQRAATLRFDDKDGGRSCTKWAPVGEQITFIVPSREVHEQIMREVAKRYKGAWLEGEEPPAPAVRKSRLRKGADVEAQEAKPQPLPENIYPGDCRHCGNTVEAKAGERLKLDGRWAVQHKAGECPEAKTAEEPQAVDEPKQERPERPAMANRFGGSCADCGVWVQEEKGQRIQREGKWVTLHKAGECIESAASQGRPPVTDEGLYRARSTGKLYRVKEGGSGSLYAQEITRTDAGNVRFERASGMVDCLSAEDRLTVEEAETLSQDWDRCIKCGAELTASRGMGPVCRKKV